jgi:hypothetical protein
MSDLSIVLGSFMLALVIATWGAFRIGSERRDVRFLGSMAIFCGVTGVMSF